MNHKIELIAKIKTNTKNISSKAYIAFLNDAATASGCLIEGELRLSRISRCLSVIARHNTSEYLMQLQQKVSALNLFRSMYTYKPNGFDLLVDDIETKFFFAAIDHGMGLKQLACMSYLFPIDLLVEFNLLNLRK